MKVRRIFDLALVASFVFICDGARLEGGIHQEMAQPFIDEATEQARKKAQEFERRFSEHGRRFILKEIKEPTVEVISNAELRRMRSGHQKLHEVHEDYLKHFGVEKHFEKHYEEYVKEQASKGAVHKVNGSALMEAKNLGELYDQLESHSDLQGTDLVKGTCKKEDNDQYCRCDSMTHQIFCNGVSIEDETTTHRGAMMLSKIKALCKGHQPRCQRRQECEDIPGAEAHNRKEMAFPQCKCDSRSAKTFCVDQPILGAGGGRSFDYNKAREFCQTPKCQKKATCEAIPGAHDTSYLGTSYPKCRCDNGQVLLCDDIADASQREVAGERWNIDDVRRGKEPGYCKYPRCGVAGGDLGLQSNLTSAKDPGTDMLTPPAKIKPSLLSKQVCAQFDLDLSFVNVPLLISLGLSGTIHLIPATKCYGWQAEMFMQFSFGFGIGKLSFRVGVVIILTVLINEVPLDAAKGDLMWELPYDYKTSQCHTQSPWLMIGDTIKESWQFYKSQILTNQYLKHPELKVQEALHSDEYKQGMQDFAKYREIMTPSSDSFSTWSALNPVTFNNAQALVSLSRGKVDIKGSFENHEQQREAYEDRKLMLLKIEAKIGAATMRRCARSTGVKKVRIAIWQDIGVVVRNQESPEVSVPRIIDEVFTVKAALPVLGGDEITVIAQVAMIGGDDEIVCTAPVVVKKVGDESSFEFGAGVHDFLDDYEDGCFTPTPGESCNQQVLKDTLSVQALSAEFKGSCSKQAIDHIAVSIKGDGRWESAFWTEEMFGDGSPWGAKVVPVGADRDRKAAAIPEEAKGRKVIDHTKPVLRLYRQSWPAIRRAVELGLEKSEVWRTEFGTFQERLKTQVVDGPSGEGVLLIKRSLSEDFVVTMLTDERIRKAISEKPDGQPGALGRFLELFGQQTPEETRMCVELSLDKPEKIYKSCPEVRAPSTGLVQLEDAVSDGEVLEVADGQVNETQSQLTELVWQQKDGFKIDWAGCSQSKPEAFLVPEEHSSDQSAMDACLTECKEFHPEDDGMVPCNTAFLKRVFEDQERDVQEEIEEPKGSGSMVKKTIRREVTVSTGWTCSFLHCTKFKFNTCRECKTAVHMEKDVSRRATNGQLIAGMKAARLIRIIESLSRESLADAVEGLRDVSGAGAQKLWSKNVASHFSDGKYLDSLQHLRWEAFSVYLSRALYQDLSFLDSAAMANIFELEEDEESDSNDIKISLQLPQSVFTLSKKYSLAEAVAGDAKILSAGGRWNESHEFDIGDGSNCKVHVDIGWMYQKESLSRYFDMEKLVPVAQSLFVAYDQFSGKLPLYTAQVLKQLEPKEPENALTMWIKKNLPYDTTDGRFLHRNLKSNEVDKVKVHEGDVGSNDAVFNYPKAFELSEHKGEKSFMYNAGLSLANLFVRSLSDLQALFNIYFANHPDWDGRCESLPARFSLYHESEVNHINDRASNWGAGHMRTEHGEHNPSKPGVTGIKYEADGVVGKRAPTPIAEDELEKIRGWHWISKAKRLYKEERRAGFFKPTAPVHGKDGWATPDVLALSTDMWPHVWCELVEQYWVEEDQKIIDEALNLKGQEVVTDISDFISSRDSSDRTFGFLDMLVDMKERLTADYGKCRASNMEERQSGALQAQDFVADITARIAKLSETWKVVTNYADKVHQKYHNDITLKIKTDLQEVLEEYSAMGEDAEPTIDAEEQERLDSERPGEGEGDAETESSKKQKELSDFEVETEHVQDSLDQVKKFIGEKSVEVQSMYQAVKSIAEAITSDTATQSEVYTHRHAFHASKEKISKHFDESEKIFQGVHSQISKLLEKYPFYDDELPEDEMEIFQKFKDESQLALSYIVPLVAAVHQMEKRIVLELQMMLTCVDLWVRPAKFDSSIYQPFATGEGRVKKIQEIRENLDTDAIQSIAVSGVEFFFEEECQVPIDYQFNASGTESLTHTNDPRPECERMIMQKGLLTMLPTIGLEAIKTKKKISEKLAVLLENPNMNTVNEILEIVKLFLADFWKNPSSGIDEDMYTGFAYRTDGSLFGELWRALPDTSTKIQSTLTARKDSRKQWIVESIQYETELKSHRRARVKQPQQIKSEVPTEIDGCVCREEWSSVVWWGWKPWKKSFKGCTPVAEDGTVADGGRIRAIADQTSIKGVCKTQHARAALERCRKAYAACDPEVKVDTRPKYRIWRSNSVLQSQVYLPIFTLDWYAHIDIRGTRGDYCTPNFAPYKMDFNYYVSASNWMPWQRKTSWCIGGRIHPPGASLSIMYCRHKNSENPGAAKNVQLHELQITTTFYLVSHYNTWGTTDGDMMQTWFTGDWATGPGAAKGWFGGGFEKTFASKIWSQEGASGFGFDLDAQQVVTSPAGFWIGLVAEAAAVFGAVAMSDFASAGLTDDEEAERGSKKSKWKAALTAVAVTAWTLLQKYGVVPFSWLLNIGMKQVVNFLQSVTGMIASPFRTEYDLILAAKFTRLKRKHERPYQRLLPQFSQEQMLRTMNEVSEAVPDLTTWWKQGSDDFLRTLDETHLDQVSSIQALMHWFRGGRSNASRSLSELAQLFGPCGSSMPIEYTVKSKKGIKIYPFYKKSFDAWMNKPVEDGLKVILTENTDGWLVKVDSKEESRIYFPQAYKKSDYLEKTRVPEINAAKVNGKHLDTLPIDRNLFENLLWAADKPTLVCWMKTLRVTILAGDKEKMKMHVDPYINNKCGAPSDLWDNDHGISPYCFSSAYFSNFLTAHWEDIIANPEAQDHLRAIMDRGPGSKIIAKPRENGEVSDFTAWSWAASLSILWRLGLPYLQVPMAFQVQIYFQVAMAFNIRQVISAVKARFSPNGKDPTNIEAYKKRVRECKACVDQGKAYCDKELVAQVMLKDMSLIPAGDTCMSKTMEDKARCLRFKLPEGKDYSNHGLLFKKEICPCYDDTSGAPIEPTWVTTSDSCEEMKLPGDGESLRRATKVNDWKYGFHGQGGRTKRLLFGDRLSYGTSREGCGIGFRCCGIQLKTGKERLRCVSKEGLSATGIFRSPKCKYFTPGDLSAEANSDTWYHIKDEFRCSPKEVGGNSAYDNSLWKYDKLAKVWAKVAMSGRL